MIHETSARIAEAMRRSVREEPRDFEDNRVPFVCDEALQGCSGMSELRDAVRHRISEMPTWEEYDQLHAACKEASQAQVAQSVAETVQNAFGMYSRRQHLEIHKSESLSEQIEAFRNKWEAGQQDIALLLSNYVRETFVPSPALIELQKDFIYYSNKLLYEGPRLPPHSDLASNIAEKITKEYRSEFLSALVLKIAHGRFGDYYSNDDLSLTSQDGKVRLTMGPISPLLKQMEQIAIEYSRDAYCHRRAVLATAFLSVLAMEEERVSRYYKLLVTEVRNALHVEFPKNWVNSNFNTPCGDLWVELDGSRVAPLLHSAAAAERRAWLLGG